MIGELSPEFHGDLDAFPVSLGRSSLHLQHEGQGQHRSLPVLGLLSGWKLNTRPSSEAAGMEFAVQDGSPEEGSPLGLVSSLCLSAELVRDLGSPRSARLHCDDSSPEPLWAAREKRDRHGAVRKDSCRSDLHPGAGGAGRVPVHEDSCHRRDDCGGCAKPNAEGVGKGLKSGLQLFSPAGSQPTAGDAEAASRGPSPHLFPLILAESSRLGHHDFHCARRTEGNRGSGLTAIVPSVAFSRRKSAGHRRPLPPWPLKPSRRRCGARRWRRAA